MLTTDQKGAVAETAIIHAAVKLGIRVFKPVNDGERCDLIFDLGPRLLRVQCKWARRQGDVVVLRCYSSRRSRDGFVTRVYTAEEVDVFAAYCPDVERCYLVPIDVISGQRYIWLRLTETRNNQAVGVRWARDFEFSRLDWERLTGP